MQTTHKIVNDNAKHTHQYVDEKSVSLVITSPPYPMIDMWDEIFCLQNDKIRNAFAQKDFNTAFELMHLTLDDIWESVDRTVQPGGIVCINIGDATRNCDGRFKLFSNHTRIINKFLSMGYDVMPDIHWHKPTNAPNKFMGSGMYPPCAYVTYEHEYILLFRKGENRKFSAKEKHLRHTSSYFWEESNIWFSDLWEIKGTAQKIKGNALRDRSAAFPFELAYRLINMFSVKDDIVLDPFIGTGTVTLAAIASERNSIGFDIDKELCNGIYRTCNSSFDSINDYINIRIHNHIDFIEAQPPEKAEKLYQNSNHRFKVKTRQETEILFSLLSSIDVVNNEIICKYEKADA